MKKFLSLLSITFLMIFSLQARELKIINLNTSSIRIGSQSYQVGNTFSDEDVIYWSSPKQGMWVKYIDGDNREKLFLTREAFANRNVKTPKEYFNKINHPSVRSDELQLTEGKNKSQFPDKRIALVIGNSNYEYQSTLSNPINDATDVTEKLVSLGFDVFPILDVNYRDFDTALKKFRGLAQSKKYDVAIMYFCGHGIQYQGQSYLVPIDAQLNDADDLYNCIDMEDVYSKMGRTNCSTNLLFIDACRTEKDWNKKEDSQRENDPQNIGVLFSSAPNSVALDGEDRNSPFAKAFIQAIGEPASDILSTINKISLNVENETNKKQEPHYVGKTSFSFTFINAYNNDKTIDDTYGVPPAPKYNEASIYQDLPDFFDEDPTCMKVDEPFVGFIISYEEVEPSYYEIIVQNAEDRVRKKFYLDASQMANAYRSWIPHVLIEGNKVKINYYTSGNYGFPYILEMENLPRQ